MSGANIQMRPAISYHTLIRTYYREIAHNEAGEKEFHHLGELLFLLLEPIGRRVDYRCIWLSMLWQQTLMSEWLIPDRATAHALALVPRVVRGTQDQVRVQVGLT